jgi:hypothetical protein
MRNVHIDRCRARSAQPSEVALSNGDAPEHEVRGSRFLFTSALSDDPLITFRLRAGRGGLLRVVLTNNRGDRFETSTPLEVS